MGLVAELWLRRSGALKLLCTGHPSAPQFLGAVASDSARVFSHQGVQADRYKR